MLGSIKQRNRLPIMKKVNGGMVLSSSAVTIAKMVRLKEDAPIELPESFLKSLRPKEGSFAVMILAPSTKIIRIIPTDSDEVIKVAIEISELSPDFLQKLGSILTKHKIKTLYSTGLCFTQDTCVYEGYVDKSELKGLSMDGLQNELNGIKGVSAVDISVLEAI